jgi:hypothetical protein
MALPVIMEWGGRLFTLVRRVDRLFELQGKVDASVQIIEDRLLSMETEGPRLITEARAAAGSAATAMSSAALNDVVTRLTRVEMRLQVLDPSPERRSAAAPRVASPRKGRKRDEGNGERG